MKKKIYIILFLITGVSVTSFSQELIIHGVNMHVSENIRISVEGKDVIFSSDKSNDGVMHLSGTLRLTGNLINSNSSSNPFADPDENNGLVIFCGNEDSNINSDGTLEFHNLTVDKVNASLIIGSDLSVTVYGNLSTESGTSALLLLSDADGTGSLIHNSAEVHASMQRHFPVDGQGWNFITSPITVMNIEGSDFEPSEEDDLYLWDESGWWRNYKADFSEYNEGSKNFIQSKGYLVSYSNTNAPKKQFTGKLNNGIISLGINYNTESNYEPGWNLIGNPYPSSIDWYLADHTKFRDNIAYVYNPENGGGGNYIYIDGLYENAIIPANQGFFVWAVEEFEFEFNNDLRVHKDDTEYKYSNTPELLTLRLSSKNYYNDITVRILEQSRFEHDRYDAVKLFSFNENMPQIYSLSRDDKKLAINSIPEIYNNKRLFLGIRIPQDGEYSIILKELSGIFNEIEIYLIDHETRKIHELHENPVYTFIATESNENERFELKFGTDDSGIDITKLPYAKPGYVWYNNNRLYIESDVESIQLEVFDINGRKLRHYHVNSGQQDYSFNLIPGVYIIRMIAGNHIESMKIIVN